MAKTRLDQRYLRAPALLLGAGVMLAGCASDRAARPAPVDGNSGWEAVFMPVETARGIDPEEAWWEGRRDVALGVRTPEPELASNQWPESPRPDLGRWRYVPLPSRPDSLIFFRPEREDRRGRTHW